uniref:toxin-antitoxin system YwqK family antitoxin n=1 Tax=Helicobacter bilis TaxID=37372 RepID=UPI0025A94644
PYKNDEIEGIEKWYYENGNLSREVPYKNNKREGIEKWYHYENGNLALEASVLNDILHGDIKLYTKDGKLLALIKAENNKFISGKCSSDKALTSKDLEESNKYPYFESAINHLEVICVANP